MDGKRIIRYDTDLQIEAYWLTEGTQPFPNHFHEHYVIGLLENGERKMTCGGREYETRQGDIVLFCPGENHACAHMGPAPLDYRAIHIPVEVMRRLVKEITGSDALPGFAQKVIRDSDIASGLCSLHKLLMQGSREFAKEERLLFTMGTLLERYSHPFQNRLPACRDEVERACAWMQTHYAERVSLEEICKAACLSKSTLLRAFTRSMGITPYRYLETVRINRAKELLRQGVTPADAAIQTGFTDQSHFTGFFNRFIGISPGAYRDIFKT